MSREEFTSKKRGKKEWMDIYFPLGTYHSAKVHVSFSSMLFVLSFNKISNSIKIQQKPVLGNCRKAHIEKYEIYFDW